MCTNGPYWNVSCTNGNKVKVNRDCGFKMSRNKGGHLHLQMFTIVGNYSITHPDMTELGIICPLKYLLV